MVKKSWSIMWGLCLSLTLIHDAYASSVNLPPPQPETTAPDIALIQKKGVLRVAFFDRGAPPFFMQDANKHWSGIEVDLAQMIADQLNVKLVIVPGDTYDDIIDMVANGKADIGMGLINITLDRALRVSYSDPYYFFPQHLLINRTQATKNGWTDPDEIITKMQTSKKPISLGALAGSAQPTILQNIFPQAKIVTYPSETAALQAVVAGDVLAALGNSPVQIHNFLQQNPKNTLITEDVILPGAISYIAAALPWQYYYLKNWLDLYFDYLEQNGIETAIFQKYNQPVESTNEFSFPA